MKSFGAYISKYLASFAAFILLLLFINVIIFAVAFHKTVTEDYGATSPRTMLERTAASVTHDALSEEAAQRLREQNIWALYLTPDGNCFWAFDLPAEIPQSYTIQDVALFSKGYLADYPVFVWNTADGLLVLGYPKNSYMKLTSIIQSRQFRDFRFFLWECWERILYACLLRIIVHGARSFEIRNRL